MRRSTIAQLGVFAVCAIPAETVLMEYYGETVRPVVSDLRERRYEGHMGGPQACSKLKRSSAWHGAQLPKMYMRFSAWVCSDLLASLASWMMMIMRQGRQLQCFRPERSRPHAYVPYVICRMRCAGLLPTRGVVL